VFVFSDSFFGVMMMIFSLFANEEDGRRNIKTDQTKD
jgi:hypothetical protein